MLISSLSLPLTQSWSLIIFRCVLGTSWCTGGRVKLAGTNGRFGGFRNWVLQGLYFFLLDFMANPSGNHQEASSSPFDGHEAANGNTSNDNSGAPPENRVMKHNTGISLDWTADEQAILEEGLANYSSEPVLRCYAKIAMNLPDKYVRDVALRCRWMSKKENSKRRKEEHNLSRKHRDKKEKVNDPSVRSSSFAARPSVPPYAPPTMDNDDGISFKAIGGAMGECLEQNAQALHQISLNLTAMQLQDNMSLFCQTRDNIHKIMNELSLNDTPEVMKQMPPLPVKLNEELANSLLNRTSHPMKP